ncbi:hypothetical protein D3C86_1551070 [compost metagenome]
MAAAICTINLGSAGKSLPFVLYQSSIVPIVSRSTPPMKRASVSSEKSRANSRYVMKKPINIA